MEEIILIRRIKILDANALSSPYTVGFPAMTAWLGAVHALQRHINKYEEYKNLAFSSVGVICHNMQPRIHKAGFSHYIINTRNPLDKTEGVASIIREAKCHLEVSLVIKYQNVSFTGKAAEIFIQRIKHLILSKIRFAGGCVVNSNSEDKNSLALERYSISDTDYKKTVMSKFMPGYALIERRDLMLSQMEKGSERGKQQKSLSKESSI
jgi:CRISPR-associated protein Csy2